MSLVTIAEFQQPEHALVLASALEAAGIPAVVPERHMHSYFPYLSLGFTAARVMVPEAMAADARAIAACDPPVEPFIPCPLCGADTRKLKARGGPVALGLAGAASFAVTSWALAIPPRAVSRRICLSCAHRFQPDGAQPFLEDETGYALPDDSARTRDWRGGVRAHLARLIDRLRAIL